MTILLTAALIFGLSSLLPAVLAENRVEVASLSIIDPTGSAPRFATSSPSLSGNKVVPVTLAWNSWPSKSWRALSSPGSVVCELFP